MFQQTDSNCNKVQALREIDQFSLCTKQQKRKRKWKMRTHTQRERALVSFMVLSCAKRTGPGCFVCVSAKSQFY